MIICYTTMVNIYASILNLLLLKENGLYKVFFEDPVKKKKNVKKQNKRKTIISCFYNIQYT